MSDVDFDDLANLVDHSLKHRAETTAWAIRRLGTALLIAVAGPLVVGCIAVAVGDPTLVPLGLVLSLAGAAWYLRSTTAPPHLTLPPDVARD